MPGSDPDAAGGEEAEELPGVFEAVFEAVMRAVDPYMRSTMARKSVSADALIPDDTRIGDRFAGRTDQRSMIHVAFRLTRYRLGILPLGRGSVNALQADFDALRQNVYWRFPRDLSNSLLNARISNRLPGYRLPGR
jgi:hypothetical protein